MSSSPSESIADLGLLVGAARDASSSSDAIEAEVLRLFDSSGPALLRYVGSFGLGQAETEDVVQDVFLSLFQHLSLGRPRSHLRGWIFRVAHRAVLKHRKRLRRRPRGEGSHMAADECVDPEPGPEEQLVHLERHRKLQAVFLALSERDRQCVALRYEGLRYREIAQVLGVSLGAVAKSLTRALARFVRADES